MQSKVCFLLAALSSILAPASADAGRIGVSRSLSNTPYGYSIAAGPARAGKQLQVFELRAGDCGRGKGWNDCNEDRSRTEVQTNRQWRYGSDFWIGFSVLIPKGFPTSRPWTTIGQIHQNDIKGLPDGHGGMHRPNHMQLLLSRGRMQIAVWSLAGPKARAKTYDLGSISKYSGKWTDIQFHLDTKNANGHLEVYVNNVRVVNVPESVTQRPKNYYFKYGIYVGGVSEWGGPIPTQQLFFDEVKIGNSRNEVLVNEAKPVD